MGYKNLFWFPLWSQNGPGVWNFDGVTSPPLGRARQPLCLDHAASFPRRVSATCCTNTSPLHPGPHARTTHSTKIPRPVATHANIKPLRQHQFPTIRPRACIRARPDGGRLVLAVVCMLEWPGRGGVVLAQQFVRGLKLWDIMAAPSSHVCSATMMLSFGVICFLPLTETAAWRRSRRQEATR